MKIDLAESDADILACFSVIRHLRDLQDAASFLGRVRSQQRLPDNALQLAWSRGQSYGIGRRC